MPIYSGSTKECLNRALSSHRDTNMAAFLAEICEASLPTVQSWGKNLHQPMGKTLIKGRLALELLGYEVSELKSLSPTVLALARVFTYGLVTEEELVQKLGYENRPKTLIEVFTGQQGLPRKKQQTAEAIIASVGHKLQLRTKQLKEKFEGPSTPELPAPVINGLGRKLIDQTITLFNSQASVLALLDPANAEIYDSDRMQLQRGITSICNALGVSVHFPKNRMPSAPVTREDISPRKP